MSGSSLTLGANTRAFTIGARAPKSSVLFAASASRSAPRPRGTGSSTRIRRTTSTPPPPPPPPAPPPPTPPPPPPPPPPLPPPAAPCPPPHPPTRKREGGEPEPQADPERYGQKENWRPHLGPPSGSHQLHRPRPAARREPYLAEPLQQRHVQLGFLLVAVEPQLDEHFALRCGHVIRREAIEREHEYVAAARFAAAEP